MNRDEYDDIEDWDAWVEEAYQGTIKKGTGGKATRNGSPSNLPAKMPSITKAKKNQFDIDWEYQPYDKAKKMRQELEKLKEEKMLKRLEESKKISWKEISHRTEYEVLVRGTSLGRVRQSFGGKWKIFPSFPRQADSYRKLVIEQTEYQDFHDSGKALVDLWVLS